MLTAFLIGVAASLTAAGIIGAVRAARGHSPQPVQFEPLQPKARPKQARPTKSPVTKFATSVSPGSRLLARLIDWIPAFTPGVFATDGPSTLNNLLGVVVMGWIYVVLPGTTALFGSSPGKLALGLKVVDRSGHHISYFHGVFREFAKLCALCIAPLLYGYRWWQYESIDDPGASSFVVR